MGKTIAIGIQSFDKLRQAGYFYIDKTDFIREWWESGDDVTLITRPRRFGKTLNMSMLEAFFSVEYKNRGDLFEGLSIWQDEKYRAMQGTYPVIFLSFAEIKENNYESAKMKIYQLIVDLFVKYNFILQDDFLSEADRTFFQSVKMDMPEYVATRAIHKLSSFLSRYYGKKVIILLDEYDTPMQEAYVNGFWEQLVSFTRSLFNSTFKTNPFLARGIMTGITRVSKESIFSDLNNPAVVTTTTNMYTTAFGFTEPEVFAALDEYGYGERKEEIKCWYDGFIFGKQADIYNPWSIINFLKTGEIETYWANTSGNGLVSKLIRAGSGELKSQFETLMRGESIQCPIDEQIIYNQLDSDEDAVWSLLLASGYLKVLSVEKKVAGKPRMYELALTNGEVMDMFFVMVRGWFNPLKPEYRGFLKSLISCDVKGMNLYMNDVALNMFSYFDTGSKTLEKKRPERFYHGFVLGLLAELNGEYSVTSNRESGLGRYDVMIEPRDTKKNDAFILEFKVHDEDDGKTLADTVAAAHEQIDRKCYAAALTAKGIPEEKIHKYGFAFEGKKVLIG
ncbi:MAG: AAA family ATPase [Lachnospiraceae bacterium]|nr:AAA family ATPase [Lachnospiraceae bacterium]